MMTKNILYLIGFRGCGKTTLGKMLAQRLQWAFVDTDVLVEEKAGCSIASMVQQHGWDFFRQAESEALHNIGTKPAVVATGGGIVLRQENCEYMRQQGFVYFLSVPASILHDRLYADPKQEQRPALTELSPLQEIENLLQERLPAYLSTAHAAIDATQCIETVADEMYMQYVTIRKHAEKLA